MKRSVNELTREEVLEIYQKDHSQRLQRELQKDFWAHFGMSGEKVTKPYFQLSISGEQCSNELNTEERYFIERNANPNGFMIIPAVEESEVNDKLAIYQRALEYKFKDFFAKEPPSERRFEDVVKHLPDLKEYCQQCYLNLYVQHNFNDPAVLSYSDFNKKTNSFNMVVDLDKLPKREKDNLRYFGVLDYISREPYKHFRKDFSFFSDNIQDPWKKKIYSIDPVQKITVPSEAKSIGEAVLLPIIEKAQKKWDKRPQLTEENQKVLQTLLEAYGKTKEFKEHPRLAEGLEERLTSVFLSAQQQGIKVSLNRYDINAPSRNAVRVQIKQQSKEKEK